MQLKASLQHWREEARLSQLFSTGLGFERDGWNLLRVCKFVFSHIFHSEPHITFQLMFSVHLQKNSNVFSD